MMSQAFARALQCYWAISSHSQDGVKSPRERVLSLLRCSWCTLTMRPSVRSATWTRTTRWPLRPTLSHYFVLSLFPLLSGTAGSHPDNLARSSAMVGGHFATTRHFALTTLVQDFARLLIPPVVVFLALVAGDHLKRVNRQLRI